MRGKLLLIFVITGSLASAQRRNYNIYFQLTQTVTFDTKYTNGETQFKSADNKTGNNTLYPLYSVLDGRPDKNFTFLQNLARKFSWSLVLERFVNENSSFNTGFEVGARGYKLISENSVSSLISYRNLAVPVYFSYYKWLGTYWTAKANYGGYLNYAWSIPRSDRVVQIEKNPMFYPLLGGGLEFAYMGKEGKLSFEIAYYKGWMNVIDHVYVGIDNRFGERITNTGTHLRVGIKYNFKRFSATKKERKKLSQKPAPSDPDLKSQITGRPVKEAEVYKAKSDSVEICFMDDQTVDGDSIALLFNGEVISDVISLTKELDCEVLHLKPGTNKLVIYAINEGKIKPNTFKIVFTEGTDVVEMRLKSDLGNSAVVEILWGE